ncbi:MAG: peptide-methionine (S)-S-oxide reductase MsrA, partial [Bacillota bacterium]|nr:peptide-methionine (S)-S-oxide reductase MsrA [Bacillota bacterium]
MKKTIYLAGGCYWGVEAFMKLLNGVTDTDVGFANGDDRIENPSYRDVCTHTTDYAETVRVVYEDSVISTDALLDQFFRIIDPTTKNRQGPDVGNQYRTGIYFETGDEAAETAARRAIARHQSEYRDPIVTEVEPLRRYYSAEESHQDYLDKNPNGYCHI